MVETIRESVIRKYRNLCQRMKITGWNRYVFISNAIELMDELEKRTAKLENENRTLQSELDNLKNKLKK